MELAKSCDSEWTSQAGTAPPPDEEMRSRSDPEKLHYFASKPKLAVCEVLEIARGLQGGGELGVVASSRVPETVASLATSEQQQPNRGARDGEITCLSPGSSPILRN